MGQIALFALIWFIIELLIWYMVGQFISGWYVFFWFIVAFVIGGSMIRKSTSVLSPMAKQMQAGGMMNPSMRPNEDSLMKTVATAIAGFLLLIPGLMSDIIALIVLLPPVQKKIKKMGNDYVMNNQEKMMEMMSKQMGGMGAMGGQNPFQNMGGMGGANNPFGDMNGANNPFGNMGGTNNPFGTNSPFGGFGNPSKTVNGTAKTVEKDVKKLPPANDDK